MTGFGIALTLVCVAAVLAVFASQPLIYWHCLECGRRSQGHRSSRRAYLDLLAHMRRHDLTGFQHARIYRGNE